MKTLLKSILLFALITSSIQAQAQSNVIKCKYTGDKETIDMEEMKIVLGDKEDKFTTNTGEEFEAKPVEGNRFKWVILDFGKYKISFNAISGVFEYSKEGKVEALAEVKCSGVREAMLAESLRKIPTQFVNPKESDLVNNRVFDLSRNADDFKAPKDSDSSSSRTVNK
tara:strand:- start:60532 stop:61035 length:504 start_codon:yes stop_codon:yes gene_type:complete